MKRYEQRYGNRYGTPSRTPDGEPSGTRAGTRAGKRSGTARRVAVAAVVAGGLLLAGCSAGTPDSSRNGADKAPMRPAPAPPNPNGGPAASAAPDDGAAKDSSGDAQKHSQAVPSYLSTFALDVDTASYGYARRTLAGGRLPAADTVRQEEFVNSFRQDYPQPEGDGFTVTTDGARTDGEGIGTKSETNSDDKGGIKGTDSAGSWSLLRVGLATRSAQSGNRPPAAMTFVVDVSGSMAEPGRLDLVKQALGSSIDSLRPEDSLAIVTFSGEARVELPMTRLGSVESRGRIHSVVDGLEPRDETNLAAGVQAGYNEAVKAARPGVTNRVVLLSDGLANSGDTTAAAILDRIGTARRDHGITLFGVGVGSQYGDKLMEQLADKGDGHTSYVAEPEAARRLFTEQLPANVDLRARDAKAQVAFDPQTVSEYRLIGFDDRTVANGDFRNDAVDGGEVGPGHTVTALYSVHLKPGASGHVATATVRWLDPSTRAPHERSGTVEAAALTSPLWTAAPKRLQVDALAAYFADWLRNRGDADRLPGAPGLPALAEHATTLASSTEDPAVRELSQAVTQARHLAG
ncbi:von Willebrand factor type A domain-containing protein [Streptomyces sp. RKAG293]|uniref:vWA domain-containing protein n=1 Tax=Streptomyces sp. RKAG293 TaxID=2893403 RepID=UPI0020333DBD|nr:von Willebrand factor type A domain-containing protein [Streptomyces sp. RKAG293]MCM2420081.1 von Willebrand factor type A domain-containing protein [Streptomyces sp. RKAG293]